MDKFYHRSRTLRLLAALIVLLSSFVLLARPPVAGAAAFTVTNTADSGPGSLRQAIADAKASPDPGPHTITFNIPETDAGCTAANECAITLTGSTLIIDDADTLTIDGAGANITLSSTIEKRVFEIYPSATLNLKWLTITNGYLSGSHGGAIIVAGTLNANDVVFRDNMAGAGGGAIFNQDGTVTVTDSHFIDNEGGIFYGGGAIYNLLGQLNVVDSTFSGNITRESGGAIYNEGGELTVTGSAFTGDGIEANAWDNGGAIASVRYGNSTLRDNISDPDVTIINSTFTDNKVDTAVGQNKGGAIYQVTGVLDVTHSTFTSNYSKNNGGAIYAESVEMTVADSTFTADNHSLHGGALYTTLTDLMVTGSTFVENSASNQGGAFYISSGTADLTNNTFSENESEFNGGAIYIYSATATVTHSTFFGNMAEGLGSAVYIDVPSSGSVTVRNSVLAEFSTAYNCFNAINGGGNISNDGTCSSTTTPIPWLLPLADNGGPTLTHALASDSPAINYVGINAAACSAADQRGIERPQGGGCDVGAYEVVSCGGSPYDVSNDAELTEAIRCINTVGSGEQSIELLADFTIYTPNSAQLGTPTLTYSGGTVTIDGTDYTLTGDGNGRFFTLGSNVTAEIEDITLTGGRANNGGAIYGGLSVAVTDSNFIDNRATGDGGAIWGYETWTTISGSEFTDNHADNGGAIFSREDFEEGRAATAGTGFVTVTGSTFTDNSASNDGGAIRHLGRDVGGGLVVAGSEFTGNAAHRGGALYSDSTLLTVENSDFNDNGAGSAGGAIYTLLGTLAVTGSDFTINTAAHEGGAIFSQTASMCRASSDLRCRSGRDDAPAAASIEGSSFTGNGSGGGGGAAINVGGGRMMVSDSTFSANTSEYGGGLFNTAGQLDVYRSTFVNNDAEYGGAIYNSDISGLTTTNSTFSENTAIEGGAIGSAGEATVTNSTFYGNEAVESGGALLQVANSFTAINSLFVDNDPSSCVGVVSGATNVADDTSCQNATVTGAEPGDILDTTLADNGGPTYTHALVEGSPAIDHVASGNPAPATDQRGVTRPQRNGVDAGAFELEQQPVTDPCAPVDGNVITNFCFEDGSAPWTFHSDGHGVYNVSPFEPFAGLGAAEIKITVPGSNVQFYQSGIALQGDTEYELTFAAKSKDGRDLSVFVHKHGANYASYGLNNHVFNLTESWAEYTVTFKTPATFTSVNDARLRFWLAPFDAKGAAYSIDRVVLRPAGGDPLPEPPPPPDPEVPPQGECTATPGNIIANPGYEDGTFGWLFFTNGSANFSTTDAAPYECDANARVKINTSGNNVQLFQTGIELEPNTHYRLRLAAKATGANAVQLFVQRHSAPHSNYGLNGLKLDLTSDWQVFVVDFTTSGFASTTTDTRLRFWLAPYDTAGAVFEFDDVVLTPVDDIPVRATDGAATRARATTADAHFISGYFIDNNHTDRLGGGYVGVLDGCRNARASVSRLWPANNKLWPVSIGNIGTPQSVQIVSVWQDEPVGFEPDAVIGTGGALHLRAERDSDAGADGRVYTIQFRATYADGQSCNGIVTVGVPLSNRRGIEARSGGDLFVSTDK